MTTPIVTPKSARLSGITVKDVAAQAGVSTATVSRVLSGKGGVRKELELRVRKAIETLNYHPNQAARRLRERKSKIIGVLVSDIQIPFFASIVVGIDKVLQEAGYLLLLGNTYDTSAGEKLHIDIFLGEEVSGIIFAPADAGDVSHYRRLQEIGMPLVAIDRVPGDLSVDTVQIANTRAASKAIQHLLQEGHERIALITGPSSVSTATERQAGYEQALKAANMPLDPGLIQVGDYTHEGAYRAMRFLMESNPCPSAVLVANSVMALGVLQYIHEHCLGIPDDVALISFDDLPWASALRPPLTVIAQPVHEIGTVAARLMLDRIREPLSSTKHVILETQLITRASCNCGKSSVE